MICIVLPCILTLYVSQAIFAPGTEGNQVCSNDDSVPFIANFGGEDSSTPRSSPTLIAPIMSCFLSLSDSGKSSILLTESLIMPTSVTQ